MKESNWLVTILKIVGFIVSLILIIWGHTHVGYLYLGVELIGHAGLLVLLWLYNRKYV